MNSLDVLAMGMPYRKRMMYKVTKVYYREYFNRFKDKEILEVGCGHGYGALAIKKYFSPKGIIATDLDPRLIDSAKSKIKDSDILFEVADATKLPYKDKSFAAVFEYGAIHHIPGPLWKKSLNEMKRVLKPSGYVFIYDNSIESFHTLWGKINRIFSIHPYNTMYKKSEFIGYLKYLGFKIHNEKNLGRYFIVIAQK